MTLQEILIGVGVICIIAGLVIRERIPPGKGFGMASVVVGVMCVLAGPAGRKFGLW